MNHTTHTSFTNIHALMYEMRKQDKDNLLLDACTMQDLLQGETSFMFDALVVNFSKMTAKATAITRLLNSTAGDLTVISEQVSEPIKKNGVAHVAILWELSDGQVVSAWFHNPDATPSNLAPNDSMISWKWLLNKRDITIVVAPEKGNDLNVREVSRRIMTLANKNSPAFTKANTGKAEKQAKIEALKAGNESKRNTLNELKQAIETAQYEKEQRYLLAEQQKTINSADEALKAQVEKEVLDAGGTVEWLAEVLDSTGDIPEGVLFNDDDLDDDDINVYDDDGDDDCEDDFDEQEEFDAMEFAEDNDLLDGDFKGHPFRGNQYKKVSRQSQSAVHASISAKKTHKKGDKKEIKKAHASAYFAHKSALIHAKGKAKSYHKKMAAFHDKVVNNFKDFINSKMKVKK